MESDLKKLLKSLASASERNANDVQVFAQPFILVETNWDWLTQNPHKCDKAKKAGDELQQFFGELIGEGNPAFRFYHTKESAWEIVNYALRRYDDAVRSGDPLRAGAVDVMRRFRRPLCVPISSFAPLFLINAQGPCKSSFSFHSRLARMILEWTMLSLCELFFLILCYRN